MTTQERYSVRLKTNGKWAIWNGTSWTLKTYTTKAQAQRHLRSILARKG
jgi:hypothetical protein